MSLDTEHLLPADVEPEYVRPTWHYVAAGVGSLLAVVALGLIIVLGWTVVSAPDVPARPASVSDAPTTGKIDTMPELIAAARGIDETLPIYLTPEVVRGMCAVDQEYGPDATESAITAVAQNQFLVQLYPATQLADVVVAYCEATS